MVRRKVESRKYHPFDEANDFYDPHSDIEETKIDAQQTSLQQALARKNGEVVVAGDGQVTFGNTVIKGRANKVRRLSSGSVIAGFAGATADAFTLFERLEAKLEQHPQQLTRACVELAKDWRTDRYLRRLEAMMAVADADHSLILSGNGDVLEPEDGLIGIGSGGPFALSAARALITENSVNAEQIALRSMKIAADMCIYTNENITIEKI